MPFSSYTEAAKATYGKMKAAVITTCGIERDCGTSRQQHRLGVGPLGPADVRLKLGSIWWRKRLNWSRQSLSMRLSHCSCVQIHPRRGSQVCGSQGTAAPEER